MGVQERSGASLNPLSTSARHVRTCDLNHGLEHVELMGIQCLVCFVWACAWAPMTSGLIRDATFSTVRCIVKFARWRIVGLVSKPWVPVPPDKSWGFGGPRNGQDTYSRLFSILFLLAICYVYPIICQWDTSGSACVDRRNPRMYWPLWLKHRSLKPKGNLRALWMWVEIYQQRDD